MISRENYGEVLLLGELLKALKVPSRMSTREWAETHRFLTSDVTSRPGKMDCMKTPWMIFLLKCLDDPKVKIIVGRKSAQIAWTETINNFIGRIIDLDPGNIILAFPSGKRAQKFFKEKLKTFIERTTVLKEKIGSLAKIAYHHIPFTGGFLSLVTLGSASDGKSSVSGIVIVEEPDDVKDNVSGQGNGLQIIIQRLKSYSNFKLIYGGTPTDEVFSQVERAFSKSNQMFYMPVCHLCGERHALSFDNLKAYEYQDRRIDPIFGKFDPSTAFYECPYCFGHWTFEEKNANVFKAVELENNGWVATNPNISIYEVAGFSFNELLSNFEQSSFENLMRLKLAAEEEYMQGKDGLLRSFRNNQEGRGYTPIATGMTAKELREKRLNYPENTVIYEGLLLTAGVDVQHNRFAIVVRAWGRYGNSWLVTWTEIFGNVLDPSDKVWQNLREFLKQEFLHAAGSGRKLSIASTTIDASDGGTTELVYQFASELNDEGVQILCSKGIDEQTDSYEIYNEPSGLDSTTDKQSRKFLSERMGIPLYKIGAHKAHSEVIRRFSINAQIGRHFHCKTAYPGYEEGVLSCRLVIRGDGLHPIWKKIPACKKEAIDCEKMALHSAFALRIREYTETEWSILENNLLFGEGKTYEDVTN